MKKRLTTLMLMVCATLSSWTQTNVKPAIPRDAALEAKIEKTLAKMTLEEGDFILEIGKHTIGNAFTQTKVWDETNI